MLYVNLSINSLDTQPTILVLTLVYLLFVIKGLNLRRDLFILFISSSIALICHYINSGELGIFLRVYAYLVSYFFLWHFGRYFFEFKSISFIVMLFWVLGLCLQLLSPSSISFLIGESRFYSGTSLSSFAPEPVWFGRIMLLFAGLAFLDYLTHKHLRDGVIAMVFVLLSLLSGSFTIYSYVALTVLSYIIFERRKYFFVVVPVALMLFLVLPEWLKVKSVLNDILENTDNILVYGGFMNRVMNVPASIYFGIVKSNGLGLGVDGIKRSMDIVILGNSIVKEVPNDNGTMHGGILSLPYYIGILGLFWSFVFLRDLFRSKNTLVISGGILLLFLEGSLMNPLAPLMLGRISKYVVEAKHKEIK